MTEARLTDELARLVLGWKAGPDRFITSGRSWLPKYRFAPLVRLDDAVQLLDRANCTYRIERVAGGNFIVEIALNGRIAEGAGEPKARTVTMAVARLLGIATEVDR